jgi:hypothetical protein
MARTCTKVIEAAKHIKYLAGTRDFSVKWMSSALAEEQGSANVIIGAVDASFAMDAMTRKSHGVFYQFCEQRGSQLEKMAAKHRYLEQL